MYGTRNAVQSAKVAKPGCVRVTLDNSIMAVYCNWPTKSLCNCERSVRLDSDKEHHEIGKDLQENAPPA